MVILLAAEEDDWFRVRGGEGGPGGCGRCRGERERDRDIDRAERAAVSIGLLPGLDGLHRAADSVLLDAPQLRQHQHLVGMDPALLGLLLTSPELRRPDLPRMYHHRRRCLGFDRIQGFFL